MNKYKNKMTPEELQVWIHRRKKCGAMKPKKGKGSYKRKKFRVPYGAVV